MVHPDPKGGFNYCFAKYRDHEGWDEFVSKITAMLKPGAGVVTTRNHVRFVVTEQGVADLYGKTIRQRAQALIQVAHPQFREELMRQAKELHYV
ncbi:MAG: acetyl-CoA hydrolase/transferase C-terminal domain-containing protein [Anaerolineales bacterium]